MIYTLVLWNYLFLFLFNFEKRKKYLIIWSTAKYSLKNIYLVYIPVNYDIILLLEICNYLTSMYYYILFIYFNKEKFLILVYGLILTAQNDLQNRNNYYVCNCWLFLISLTHFSPVLRFM